MILFFFFSSRRRHTRWPRDWSSDVCSSDLSTTAEVVAAKNAVLVTTRAMASFVHNKVAAVRGGGKPMDFCSTLAVTVPVRSEERRVGKECRSRWGPGHEKKKRVGWAVCNAS